ncbi:MAG: HutD family protein, partial [Glaciimonas sp.]|nr:HutD family protein [Glaciimonas sp.]
VTRELACHPRDAHFDDFLWRVSIADIKQSGSFSVFPNIDRVITLLHGDGMQLNFDDGKNHALTTPLQPYRFSGEKPLIARLVGGVCHDVNLMLRRGTVSGDMQVLHTAQKLSNDVHFRLLFCVHGHWEVKANNGVTYIIAPHQTLTVEAQDGALILQPKNDNCALLSVHITLLERPSDVRN